MAISLTELKPTTQKQKKRLGRGLGSGAGAKSGRGTTRHQVARENVPLHFEGGQNRMVKKYALIRGKGKNKSKRQSITFRLSDLRAFQEGEIVSRETLLEKQIISPKERNLPLKIINSGTIEQKLTVEIPVTPGAKQAIEKVGGQVASA